MACVVSVGAAHSVAIAAMMEVNLPETTKKSNVLGNYPAHVHQDGVECNSPYCEDVAHTPAPEKPIHIGQEPWRGRA